MRWADLQRKDPVSKHPSGRCPKQPPPKQSVWIPEKGHIWLPCRLLLTGAGQRQWITRGSEVVLLAGAQSGPFEGGQRMRGAFGAGVIGDLLFEEAGRAGCKGTSEGTGQSWAHQQWTQQHNLDQASPKPVKPVPNCSLDLNFPLIKVKSLQRPQGFLD